MRRPGLRLLWLLAILPLAIVLLVVGALRGGLARLDGASRLPGLTHEVVIERDDQGVPTVQAQALVDADRALGFLHAQDRYFQMDLLRRSAAGEMSELFGPVALEFDRSRRRLQFRQRAQRALVAESAALRLRVQAYSEGVNAGLDALRARPFEYWLLRQKPRSWSPEDCYLVLFAMFLDLQSEDNELDLLRGAVQSRLPDVAAFLFRPSTPWDAPLVGEPSDWPQPPADLQPGQARAEIGEPFAIGSNAFALGAARCAGGAAMLASDMHLGLRLPNIWYRVRLLWASPERKWDCGGLSLPGAPGLVAGSNRHLAWSFTNSYADAVDWVELSPSDSVQIVTELIHVARAATDTLRFGATRHGPLLHASPRLALAWVALRPGGANLQLLEMMQTERLDAALDLLPRCGIPAQNAVLASDDGRVAWTIAGRLPRRRHCDGRSPWSAANAAWDGWVDPDSIPRWIRAADGEIWSANSRAWIGGAGDRLGDGGYALGARATQIRDRLQPLHDARPSDLAAIQLDDRALFLAPWRDLLLSAIALAPHGEYAALREAVEAWGARASVESVGYRIVRSFRLRLRGRLLGAWLAPLAGEIDLAGLPIQSEAAIWVALRDRPAQLLPSGVSDWDTLLLEELDALAQEIGDRVDAYRWGEHNRLRMGHPMARSLGPLGRWLRMPEDALAGDSFMPRVQGPAFGAAARFVVPVGKESEGWMQAAGGISGNPLSPYFDAGHRAWVRGEGTPFWPGPARHRLRLSGSSD